MSVAPHIHRPQRGKGSNPHPSEISWFLILRGLVSTLDSNLRWDSANELGAL